LPDPHSGEVDHDMGAHARDSRSEVICVNGHENPDGHYFCGECGVLLEAGVVVCLAGHANADYQRFCGECGAPLVAPPGVEPVASTARWSVDPTGRHQCRYWDGVKWTSNVADIGRLGIDQYGRGAGRLAETWVGLAAGLVTVALLAGAGADIWVQLSRDAAKQTATAQVSSTSPSTPTPTEAAATTSSSEPPLPPPPPEPPAVRGLAVIATPCLAGSTDGTTADGSVAYCGRLQGTETYMWSLNPGDIPAPVIDQGQDPAVAVCMVQTERTELDCVEYLKRPSDPGVLGPPA
jgi:hypothetical protein